MLEKIIFNRQESIEGLNNADTVVIHINTDNWMEYGRSAISQLCSNLIVAGLKNVFVVDHSLFCEPTIETDRLRYIIENGFEGRAKIRYLESSNFKHIRNSIMKKELVEVVIANNHLFKDINLDIVSDDRRVMFIKFNLNLVEDEFGRKFFHYTYKHNLFRYKDIPQFSENNLRDIPVFNNDDKFINAYQVMFGDSLFMGVIINIVMKSMYNDKDILKDFYSVINEFVDLIVRGLSDTEKEYKAVKRKPFKMYSRHNYAIIGLGGIGNNVNYLLGQKEYCRAYSADFDILQIHNLNRSASFKLSQIPLDFRSFKDGHTVRRKGPGGRIDSVESFVDVFGNYFLRRTREKTLRTIVDCRDVVINEDYSNLYGKPVHHKLSYNGASNISIHFNFNELAKYIWTTETGNAYEVTPSFISPPLIISALFLLVNPLPITRKKAKYINIDIDNIINNW